MLEYDTQNCSREIEVFLFFIFGISLKNKQNNWQVDSGTLNITIGYSAGSVCDEGPNKMLLVEQRLWEKGENLFKILNIMTGLNP